ncbi:hypothetical protein AV530_007900 [Patagioenas fasciata monilis]|uniref:Uncharacterized protein n=1 Tax=Patagioenas fasciata monilis TaxID=372326 RepID=A0A1V4J8N7_PATFA|nr:hypothetical protein AV530_007900 [Patagioenas fasciata monilis]
MELSALLVQSQKQNEEKEKIMKTLQDTVEILEAGRLEKEHEVLWSKSAKEENLSLQKLIKDITEVRAELGPHPCKRGFRVLEEGNSPAWATEIHVGYYLW